MTIRTVAIIGAGVSGVSSAVHLKNAGINVTVFERGTKAGGVCGQEGCDSPEFESKRSQDGEGVRRDSPVEFDDTDKLLDLQHAPPGPCYMGLMNNVSTPQMELKTHKWKTGTADFVKHDALAEYIQETARANGVEDKIEFQTRVDHVEKIEGRWRVHTSTLITDNGHHRLVSTIRNIDAVVVASGHYHAPNVPGLPGLADWKQRFPDRIQHSKGYRNPSRVAGKNVLLIGAGVSSTDIARELGPVAGRIYQSSRGGLYDLSPTLLPDNCVRVGEIKAFQNDNLDNGLGPDDTLPGTVRLASGEDISDLHHVIVATGYHMSYPFLRSLHADNVSPEAASDTVLVTSGQVTHNLHKDIFYIPDPTLAFIGVPYHVATFSLFEFQAMALAAIYSGQVDLPSESDMRKEYNERVATKGIGRNFHSLKSNNGEIEYVKDMVRIANQGRKPEEYLEGHTKEWLKAYQVRLIRMALRRPVQTVGSLRTATVADIEKHHWDIGFGERNVDVKQGTKSAGEQVVVA